MSTDNMLVVIIGNILEEDGHMTCEKPVTEPRITKSSVDGVLTEVVEKRKVTVCSITTQDLILHKL